MKTTYRFASDGQLRDHDGMPLLNQEERARPPQMPMVFGDIEPHLFSADKDIGTKYVGTREDARNLARDFGWHRYERVGDSRKMPNTPFNERADKWGAFMQDTKSMVAERAGLDSKSLAVEEKARKAFGSTRDKLAREGRLMKAD